MCIEMRKGCTGCTLHSASQENALKHLINPSDIGLYSVLTFVIINIIKQGALRCVLGAHCTLCIGYCVCFWKMRWYI